ncbi:acetyl-lysine deacetylase [Halobacteriales archaeon QH_7_69_31]|nr:MAG: acetyl-lysine deacetylase [Halobacteriales archaeon QH_7_69_31]
MSDPRDDEAALGEDVPPDDEARDLLETLVSIPSPSGEEAECAAALVAFLEAHGREVYRDEVGNVRAPADDAALFTSHVDTVPGEIPVRIEDGEEGRVLWGRGSVDAKGSLAALAVAAVRTGVSFAGVVGEETTSRGARHLVADREPPDALVNGEPSGWDAVTLGYRGILQGTYVATSESGHTSRPANNAIQDAIAWWAAVEERFAADEYEPVFEQVTPKPVAIEGGVSDDGLAVEASIEVQLRVPPGRTTEAVRELADGELDAGTVRWTDAVEPTMQRPKSPVARAFRAAIRQRGGEPRQLRKTGTADTNVYAGAWDCPMATYGPGDSSLDHAPDERLPLADLDRAVTVLEAVGEDLS